MAVAMDAMAVAIHIKYALNQKRYLTSYSRSSLKMMYSRWPKVNYPCGKLAISWQQHKFL